VRLNDTEYFLATVVTFTIYNTAL